MTGRLAGKVAIVTAASNGNGAGIAALFAREGARVIVAAEEYEGATGADGDPVLKVGLDVRAEAAWHDVTALALERFGRIDILVNDAGSYVPLPFDDCTLDDWQAIMAANATGIFLGLKHVAPAMRVGGGGSIVNLSSIAGILGFARIPAFGAAQGAVRTLTKDAALAYAPDSIRVNSIHAGVIRTPLYEAKGEAYHKRAAEIIPLPHLGEVADVAYGALYLASDESRYVTGTELVIDGGRLAR